MPMIPLSPAAKAYTSALVTLVVTVLSAATPILDGTASTVATIVLAVAAAYGFTYAVPNRPAPTRPTPPQN